jgi:hypothetical protein
VADLSPLSGLPLRELDLYGSAVTDLRPLATISSLTHLEVAGTAVADLSPLTDLPIEDLDVRELPVEDWSPLADLASLEVLVASDNPGFDLGAIAELPLLRRLEIRNCGVTSLVPLERLAGQLRMLDVCANPLQEMGAFLQRPPIVFEFSLKQLLESAPAIIQAWRRQPETQALAEGVDRRLAFYTGDVERLRRHAITYRGHQYVLVEEELTFDQARHLAEQVGGYLVEPDDPQENQFLRSLAGSNGIWIGVMRGPRGWRSTRGKSIAPLAHRYFTDDSATHWHMMPDINALWLPYRRNDSSRGVVVEWDD